jgi:hypothetical protein
MKTGDCVNGYLPGEKEIMTEIERRQRLRQWLDIIYREVKESIIDNHIFWAVQEMFKSNSRLAEAPGTFNIWMAANFSRAAAVGVRRQTDRNNGTVSLYRFLLEIQKFPTLLSRDSVIARYAETNASFPADDCTDLANGEYDRLVGVGKSAPDPRQMQVEINSLLELAGKIKHYVDKRIAHYDEKGPKQPIPKLSDLETCYSFFEEMIKKYKVLLEATGLTQILPMFQYDWKAIFRFPWLDDQSSEQAHL